MNDKLRENKPDIYRENLEDKWHIIFKRGTTVTTCNKQITSDWLSAFMWANDEQQPRINPRRSELCSICWKFYLEPAPYKDGRKSLWDKRT